MADQLLESLSVSLTLTLAAELVFALLWGLRKQDLLLVVLMNLLTNPPAVTVWFLLCIHGSAPRWLVTLCIEGAVVLIEGVCLSRRGQRVSHPWILAFLINLFSYSFGFVLARLI